ncbi:hypothetical protein F5887DRAFT_943921 [Amanita rubescens]|nr:hypothetical protein F5887DRAFT_943921 [Amanita rubescens]
MVKCGPKPRQVSARQLRNLAREEKKSKALKCSARPPPTPPSSPRVKKRVYTRPSQYDVSLSRKKQAKAKQRLVTVRKSRTESSLAFSAITEEVPLFEIVKPSSNLVYTPQAPVPLVYPMTPPMGKPTTSTNDASESVIFTSLSPGSNDVSSNTPNDEMEHLATPKLSLHTFQVRPSSPCDQVVECRPTLLSQSASGLDAVHTPPREQDVVLHTPTVNNSPSRRPSPSILLSKDARHVGDLVPSQVLSQLPIEQEPDLAVSPRVILPKRLSLSPRRRDSLLDSPETSYHRSLMSSIWAPKPADLSPGRKQLDLRDALHVYHPNRDINVKSEQVLVQECHGLAVEIEHRSAQGEGLVGNAQVPNPLSSNSLTRDQPDAAPIPILGFTLEPDALAKNPTDDFGSNRRVLDGHKNRHSLGANPTSGAFVNAVLRQTGHLRERGTVPERLPRNNHMSKPVLYDSPVLGSALKMKKDGFGIHPTVETSSRLFNTLRFQSIRNESLQSRAPTASPCQLRSNPPTDDPLRRPSVRPTRKRLIPVGRVITYNATSPNEVQGRERQSSNDASRPDTSSMSVAQEIAQVKPEDPGTGKQDIPSANWATTRTRSKRHWAKRVVADDICHRVSMEYPASPPAIAYVAPDFNIICDAQSPFGAVSAQTGGSIKQRITATLRAVYNRLWA